jgi:hypothetical protein
LLFEAQNGQRRVAPAVFYFLLLALRSGGAIRKR